MSTKNRKARTAKTVELAPQATPEAPVVLTLEQALAEEATMAPDLSTAIANAERVLAAGTHYRVAGTARHGNTKQRNMEYAKREWRTQPDGVVVRTNTRRVALDALLALEDEAGFTPAAAVAALAPLAKAGSLGANSTAKGYWNWLVRTGRVVAA